jgi:hypothetical protein
VGSQPEFPARRLRSDQLPALEELLGGVPESFEVIRCDGEAVEIVQRPAPTITVCLHMDAEGLKAERTVRDRMRERLARVSAVDAIAQVNDWRGTLETIDEIGVWQQGLELARQAQPDGDFGRDVAFLEALQGMEERYGPPEDRGVASTLLAAVDLQRAFSLLGPEHADGALNEEELKQLERDARTKEFMDVTLDSIPVVRPDFEAAIPADVILGDMSFEDFVRFLFSRPDPGGGDLLDDEPAWAIGDKGIVASHLIRLFRDPSFLFDDYTDRQIGLGFGRLVRSTDSIPGLCGLLSDSGTTLDWGVAAVGVEVRRIICGMHRSASIWLADLLAKWSGLDVLHQETEPDLPLRVRQEFVASMYGVFEQVVAKGVDGPWPFWCEELILPSDHPDVARTQLETMLRIARLDCQTCRDDVCGALPFFRCPGLREALEEFLRTAPEIDDGTRARVQRRIDELAQEG